MILALAVALQMLLLGILFAYSMVGKREKVGLLWHKIGEGIVPACMCLIFTMAGAVFTWFLTSAIRDISVSSSASSQILLWVYLLFTFFFMLPTVVMLSRRRPGWKEEQALLGILSICFSAAFAYSYLRLQLFPAWP